MTIKTSLIITTYNWPEALDLVLRSVAQQHTLPDEVLIADDGSGPTTAALLARWEQELQVPLVHVWQEDQGFRVARIRNLATAVAKGDYLIFVDGDMVLHPRFVDDHLWAARKGCFIQGMRVLAGQRLTLEMLEHKISFPNIFNDDLIDRKFLIRSRLLSFFKKTPTDLLQRAKGCNMAFWKEDLRQVNGFNEDMVGWGAEDKELTVRLLNNGCRRYLLKFNAVAVHVYHKSRGQLPQEENPNQAMLNAAISQRLTWCHSGLDRNKERGGESVRHYQSRDGDNYLTTS